MSTQDQLSKSDASRAGKPKVSVVVPSFNHAPFIQTTLRSIFNQTQAPAQLIVIDDGSSDGSPEIIKRLLQDCPFPSEIIARSNRAFAQL